jgi:hypothetical protein
MSDHCPLAKPSAADAAPSAADNITAAATNVKLVGQNLLVVTNPRNGNPIIAVDRRDIVWICRSGCKVQIAFRNSQTTENLVNWLNPRDADIDEFCSHLDDENNGQMLTHVDDSGHTVLAVVLRDIACVVSGDVPHSVYIYMKHSMQRLQFKHLESTVFQQFSRYMSECED